MFSVRNIANRRAGGLPYNGLRLRHHARNWDKIQPLCQLPPSDRWRDSHFFAYPILLKKHHDCSRSLLYIHRKQNAPIPHATRQAPQTNLARIDYLPPDGQQVTLKGTDNVKIRATYFTKLTCIDTNIHHISKDKARTLAARILHVMNNREV